MSTVLYFWHHLEEFPEYLPGLAAAFTILIVALPIYLGILFFLYRRRLHFAVRHHVAFLSVFVLFAGLAFLLGTPLSKYVHPVLINAYLFITCMLAAYAVVALLDIFFVQHYLMSVRRVYISPPLRKVIQIGVFLIALLPILHFVLKFNPLTLVAIPTIATAGIALALQDTLKTFIAGIGLGKVIRVGQWIAFQDKEGRVIDINWARTVLRTMDGDILMIPNNQLQTQSFTNYTADRFHRMTFKVGVSYKAPPLRVKQVLERSARDLPGAAAHPEPAAVILSYGEGAIQYALYFWVEDYAARFLIQDQVATRVWEAFRQEGFELPVPFPSKPIQDPSEREGAVLEPVLEALRHWDLARAFSAEGLTELARWAQVRSFLHGEEIIAQGQAGDSMFLILEGAVEVFDASSPTPIAVLKKQQVFGEMSLLTGAVRNATVRAQGPVEALEIGKLCLQKVLAKNPEATERLANLVSERQAVLASHVSKVPEGGEEAAPGRSLAHRIRHFLGL